MTTTETTQAPRPKLDPAKLRQGARDDLASLAVAYGVINDLTAVVDERWSEVYRTEARIRVIFGHLGCPQLVDGPFEIWTVLAKLDEWDAAAKEAPDAEACKNCSKPIEPCKVQRSHAGCSSGYGYIHRNGGHTCEQGSDGPYAQPITAEPAK